jgi:hypothetical protein
MLAQAANDETQPGGAAVGNTDGSLPTVADSSSDDKGSAPLLTAEEAELGVTHAAEDGAAEEEQ